MSKNQQSAILSNRPEDSSHTQSKTLNSAYDAVVVGAGFAGLYMLHKLRELGLAAVVLERGAGVGGTWYWNRYPGARCDVESMEYSYGFSEEIQQQWQWTEKYSAQPEILKYANFVTDHLQLRGDIHFNTAVSRAYFQESKHNWLLETATGTKISARFCIMATGCLSCVNKPKIPGLENFKGRLLHTGLWPHEKQSFQGEKVGVIGTGSSAIQSIPLLADEAEHLTVFQRTASFSVPARNAAMDKEHEREVKANYADFRKRNASMFAALNNRANPVSAQSVSSAERTIEYEQRWQDGGLAFLSSFNDLGVNAESNATAREFIHSKIKELVIKPETAELLCPQTVVGCKRLCVDTDYYQTFNRNNVTLVDVKTTPIQHLTHAGVVMNDIEYAFDSLIFATGFDAMTGALLDIDIRGRRGITLAEKWAEGPQTYLGLCVADFPNLFTITGPGSPSVLANMIVAIEQHVEWISACIASLQGRGLNTIEAEQQAQDDWVMHVNELASGTLYPSGCNSWYLGANIPGKPRVFMPYLGFPAYVTKCDDVVADNYRGFRFG